MLNTQEGHRGVAYTRKLLPSVCQNFICVLLWGNGWLHNCNQAGHIQVFILEGVFPPSPVAPRAKRSCAVFPPSSTSVVAKHQLSYSGNTKGKTLKPSPARQGHNEWPKPLPPGHALKGREKNGQRRVGGEDGGDLAVQGQNLPLSAPFPGHAAPSLPSHDGFKDVSCEARLVLWQATRWQEMARIENQLSFSSLREGLPMLPSVPGWSGQNSPPNFTRVKHWGTTPLHSTSLGLISSFYF